jgi:hypothetical protein
MLHDISPKMIVYQWPRENSLEHALLQKPNLSAQLYKNNTYERVATPNESDGFSIIEPHPSKGIPDINTTGNCVSGFIDGSCGIDVDLQSKTKDNKIK